MSLSLNLYQSMALAVAIFYFGAFLKSKISVFRTYCIPSPVIGGIIYAIVNLILYQTGVLQLSVDTTLQSVFMNVFFTSVGFTAGFGMLKKGGKSLIVFLVAVCILIGIQDVAGAALCKVFGLQPLLGLALGSMPLTGGHGTTTAFAPLLESMGVQNALTVGVAAATYGLVAGSLMGGPTARSIIQRYNLTSTENDSEIMEISDETAEEKARAERVDVDSFTNAAILLIVASGIGTLLTALFNAIKIGPFTFTFPTYIGAMVIAAIIRNFCDSKRIVLPSTAIDIWGSVSLSIFLAIALMTLKLWELASLAVPMVVMLLAQTVLMFFFARFVVFNIMGRDYEAAVMTSAFCGFGMGATPNAMANMDALTKVFGPSEKAYLIIPVCGGFFTDIVNSLILTFFMNVL